MGERVRAGDQQREGKWPAGISVRAGGTLVLKLGRGDGGGRRLCYQITPMPGREARWSSQGTRPKQAKKDRVSFCPYNYVPWETSAEFKPKQTNRTGDWTLLCRYVNSSSWMGVGVRGRARGGGNVSSAAAAFWAQEIPSRPPPRFVCLFQDDQFALTQSNQSPITSCTLPTQQARARTLYLCPARRAARLSWYLVLGGGTCRLGRRGRSADAGQSKPLY